MPDPNYVSPRLADIASMTHQPLEPNPVPPIVNRAVELGQQFRRGGLTELAAKAGYVPPGVSDNPFSRLIRSQGMEDASGFLGQGGALGTLRLFKNGKPDQWGQQDFHVVNDWGETVGEMSATGGGRLYKPGEVHVDWLGSLAPGQSQHSIGLSDIRTLPEAMLEHYPDMESISATRISGARRGPASTLQPNRANALASDWDKLAAVLEGPLIKRYLDKARAAHASGKPGYAHIEHLYDEERQPLQPENME